MKFSAKVFLSLLLLLVVRISSLAQAQPPTRVSCPEAAQYYSKDSINIVTFGASTVEGVNGVGFQTMLQNNFINCYTNKIVDITNHGIGGQTTFQGLLRIDNAIANRTGFIVIDMGINDAIAMTIGKGSVAETVANMRVLITASLKQKLVPILCTLQFVDDRTIKSYVAVNTNIRNLNTAYRKLAAEYKIYLADVNAAMRRDFSLYQDPFHPNARGYRLVSYVIFDAINKAIFDKFLKFTVSQNYPNPAAMQTFIDVVLPETDKINIQIFDLMGRLVKTVVNEYLNTGKHTLEINTSTFVPGIYFFKISSDSGQYNTAKKFIVAR
ncbi:SGNH/GDSL hydrolase family protein [Pedobacter sp. ISL-68]|uniref:SGNH/GDSL hydrolase family protein n=1 Tax=unclassified Pedobacter TaxID=2628915 RepID=UPI001BE79841|nr:MULTISPECIES: SGNH/GDSL hydrolase family protein [unclassified Pedobacter]MBT2561139.1 SGNH/GDSL hydrolase family protein [Pedobacter sp. ISL-64]MBT2590528.1 SGNH/GDSL hydrolase family protein [Pedobacter sp. ISL-68]